MKTGRITFNVRERGRQYRGQDRNFDTVALAQLINGPETQERVKNRDLVGYFGHWPRVVFGLTPGEGGILDGKQVTLEPALVTTHLRAMPDGTIEHEAEFLDTAPGRTSRRLFASKAGGFSSAINVREFGGKDMPIGFHGFDYVMEPNFTTNRGYALDGVFETEGVVLDSAMRETAAAIRVLDGIYNELQQAHERQAEVINRLAAENAELVDMVARAGIEREAKAKLARLDSADGRFLAPPVAAGGQVVRLDSAPMVRMARQFETMELQGFEPLPPPPADPALTRHLRKLGQLVTNFMGD